MSKIGTKQLPMAYCFHRRQLLLYLQADPNCEESFECPDVLIFYELEDALDPFSSKLLRNASLAGTAGPLCQRDEFYSQVSVSA